MKANEIDLFFSQSPSPLIQHQLQFHTLIIPPLVAPKIPTQLGSKLLRRWEIRISPDGDQRERSRIKVQGDTCEYWVAAWKPDN